MEVEVEVEVDRTTRQDSTTSYRYDYDFRLWYFFDATVSDLVARTVRVAGRYHRVAHLVASNGRHDHLGTTQGVIMVVTNNKYSIDNKKESETGHIFRNGTSEVICVCVDTSGHLMCCDVVDTMVG